MSESKLNMLMIGTGEYTTGYVQGKPSTSDKSSGVVALTLFDLRKRGLVGRLGLCGTTGLKFPGMRDHLHTAIASKYNGLDVACETFPNDDVQSDPLSYISALGAFNKGDAVTIFVSLYYFYTRCVINQCALLYCPM